MYNITAIVPKGQGTGFTLAGVEIREVANSIEAQKALADELTEEHNGIILIDEAFTTDFPNKFQKEVDESTIPLVVSIPIITHWEDVYDHEAIIGNIIRRAVGYRIKFSE